MNADAARNLSIGLGAACALLAPGLCGLWIGQAEARLAEAEASADEAPQVAIAAAASEGYCNAHLKKVLKRVLASCGLLGGEGRGCQPLEARNIASVSGDDFNSLFVPLAERAAIVQFDLDGEELDRKDKALLNDVFTDKRGASYFFVVSRSSPEGDAVYNQQLSERRGAAVLTHLQDTFQDPDLEREVGLLWLGEEFAQLDQDFCDWRRSGEAECDTNELNRSAFVTWVDCTL